MRGDLNSPLTIVSDGTVYIGTKDKKPYAIIPTPKAPLKALGQCLGRIAQRTGRVMK